MELPKFTRLSYIKSKSLDDLVIYVRNLGVRIQIYGSPQFNGKAWVLWFVPDDRGEDILPIDLDSI